MTAASDRDSELALVLAALSDRARRGEAIDLEGEMQRRPEIAQELRELWGAVMLAEAVGKQVSDSLDGGIVVGSEVTGVFHTPAPGSLLALPCRWGEYELVEELGRGGMGVVYRARQMALGRDVALKMVLRGAMATPADHERFRAEAHATAQLEHPGIVPVYEVGERDERPYFTMQLIAGETLAQRLAEGPLPAREAATLLSAIARAIDFAHKRGVLHRDLKPSNILLDLQGQPHVTDFGLAKQFQAGDAASLTRTGAILGTPAYMAPEQAAGDRGRVGPTSDVYSLGAILYHLLTGRPPFVAASPVDTVLLVLEQDPVPPTLLNPKADADLEMICLRCLQKPPDLRYATAAALADDLDAYLAGESISARSGQFADIIAGLFRETHHATILENWGLLWIWHSLVLLGVCIATNVLHWVLRAQFGDREPRWPYIALWTIVLGTWAAVFWMLRRRVGPVTFVERQIAHLWAGSMISIAMLFPVEMLMGLPVLVLSPLLGLVNGMVFMAKAAILSGQFYVQAIALFLTALAMAWWPDYAHILFGLVSALCFFVPGVQYYRQRLRAERRES